MTNMQLLEAIGMIDEETVADADQKEAPRKAPRRLLRQICAACACACLLLGSAIAVQMGGAAGAKDGAIGNSSAITNAEDGAPDKIAGIPAGGTTTLAAGGLHDAVGDDNGEIVLQPTQTTATQTVQATQATQNSPLFWIPVGGLQVYNENFDAYANTPLTADVPAGLAWTKLTVEENGVYGDSDILLAISDGRLYFRRSQSGVGYFAIDLLDDDYMKPVVMGKYTLQYDLTYLAGSSLSGTAAIITELSRDGKCYHQFTFLINGAARHQCHFYGSWKSYAAYDPATDLNPMADAPDGSEGTPLLTKLTGLDWATHSESRNLEEVTVTVRLQWDPECGHHVYMKTAAMTDFIKVSEPSDLAEGIMYTGWEGYAVAFRASGVVEGYLDNIRIWTDWNDEPSEERYLPPKK